MSNEYTLEEQKERRKNLIVTLRGGYCEPLVVEGKFNRDGYSIAGIIMNLCRSHDYDYNDRDRYGENILSCCANYFGFTTLDGYYSMCDYPLFDNDDLTFDEVADIIEEEPDGLINQEEKIVRWIWEEKKDGSYERKVSAVAGYVFESRVIKWTIKERNGSYLLTTVITTTEKDPNIEEALKSAINRGNMGGKKIIHMLNEKQLGITKY